MAGVPRVINASVGGRVMCANNQPVRTNEKLADFDGVSLYPSSMARIPGYLLGAPKVWHKGVDVRKVDGYSLRLHWWGVNSVPVGTIEGGRWRNLLTNDLEGQEVIVDRFTLEDLVIMAR